MTEQSGLLVKNGRVATANGIQTNIAVGINRNRIVFIGNDTRISDEEYPSIIDAGGAFISPGLIDSHTHGGAGYDFLTVADDEIDQLLEWYASNGVTAVLATLSAGLKDGYLEACQVLTRLVKKGSPGARLLGIHIEGPYISKEKKGAQPFDEENPVKITDVDEYLGYFDDAVRIMTLAPEIDRGIELIDHLVSRNVICSVGHSDATYEEIIRAVMHGLNRSTHTFNTMSQLEHHSPGIVGAVMVCDEIFAEITLDGSHVHPGAVKALLKAKGLDKMILITDSIQASGLGDGEFIRPGDRHIYVKDNVARLKSGNLAGSVLTLNQAVKNAVTMLDLPLGMALKLATQNVANSLGLKNFGILKEGSVADIIVHDEEMNIYKTIIDGRLVYSS
ncbi:MAG: N-acetylglucosamine-6-phosphate deacetylase [Chloroflexi bacterium]|nr:N-acetylglucosamine-6-phosphate deacetylase [Chloroflexota bacterium]